MQSPGVANRAEDCRMPNVTTLVQCHQDLVLLDIPMKVLVLITNPQVVV